MQQIGIVLLLVGMGIFLITGGVGFLQVLFAPEFPLVFKVAILAIVGGVLLIVLSAVKENWGKKDKYEEVEK